MMKQVNLIIPVFILFVLSTVDLKAQEERPYDPALNGHEQLKKAIQQAQLDNKHVFIMIGGNW